MFHYLGAVGEVAGREFRSEEQGQRAENGLGIITFACGRDHLCAKPLPNID